MKRGGGLLGLGALGQSRVKICTDHGVGRLFVGVHRAKYYVQSIGWERQYGKEITGLYTYYYN